MPIQGKKYTKKMIANSKEKTLILYENGKIIETFHHVCFGKNGVTPNKKEGDGCTPLGLFSLGFAFGTNSFSTTYPYYEINDSTFWVSDSTSLYYNCWVEVTNQKKKFPYSYMHTSLDISWQEAEHLLDFPRQYELALVIEYNTHHPKLGKGSAIFLHVKNKDYTLGCIGVTKKEMETIIKWLENNSAIIEIC